MLGKWKTLCDAIYSSLCYFKCTNVTHANWRINWIAEVLVRKTKQQKIILNKHLSLVDSFHSRYSRINIYVSLCVVRWGPGEETQASPWWILLHPNLSDCCCLEEDAAHRPQHVHPRWPGAHLSGQDSLQPGKMMKYDWVEFRHWKWMFFSNRKSN